MGSSRFNAHRPGRTSAHATLHAPLWELASLLSGSREQCSEGISAVALLKRLSNLRRLSGNKLTSLPPEIRQLTHLREVPLQLHDQSIALFWIAMYTKSVVFFSKKVWKGVAYEAFSR